MAAREEMAELANSDTITCGFVYRENTCEKYWFQGTPENISAFIARFPDGEPFHPERTVQRRYDIQMQ